MTFSEAVRYMMDQCDKYGLHHEVLADFMHQFEAVFDENEKLCRAGKPQVTPDFGVMANHALMEVGHMSEPVLLESAIEARLKLKLECHGFKVLKLVTPGTNGTPDRIILRPIYAPGPPWVIELKRPGKNERRLQEIVRDDWRARGVCVLDMVNTYEQVDALCERLVVQCRHAAGWVP